MTHDELVTDFVKQGLKKGSLVEIELTSGQVITGILSDSKVHANETDNTISDSRIGILPPAPPKGQVSPKIITPIYTENIVSIKLQK